MTVLQAHLGERTECDYATLSDTPYSLLQNTTHGDSRCTEVISRESSSPGAATTARSPEPEDVATRSAAPTTWDGALRLAIKLAVDAGEYERAAALLDVAKGHVRV